MDASSYTQQDQQQARWGYDPTLSPDIQLELEADLMSQAQNGEYNLQAYADAGPSSSHVQFTASNEFGSGNTPADAFSSIPLPPSQPPSHRPSRANSRSSSLTRSPPLPLDHSHVGGGGQHTAQTFPSFAQYAAFLTTDGGAQPAEYGAPRPTYNFSHTQAQGQGQPPSPPNFTVAGAQFAPGPGAIDTSSGHYVHGHGQQYPRSSGSGHYPTSSGSAHYPTSSGSAHYPTQQAKRKRMTQPGAEVHDSRDGDEMDFEDDGHSGGGGGQHGGGGQGGGGGSGGVVKPSGACARCKTLKVKCEFVTGANGGEADSCKRCANGGHECVVPGRKKRKSPPKREHLLTQIREQAAQIQKLMSQLERPARGGGQHQGQFLNAQQHPHHSQQHGQRAGGQHAQQHAQFRMPTSASASEISFASLHSPILSPTSAGAAGYDGGAQLSQIPPPPTTKAEADVAAWLAKARGSLAEFDGLLGATPVLQGYLVAGDDSDHSSDDGDYHHYDYDDEHDPDLNDLDDMDYANGGGGYGARARDDVDSEDSEFEIEVLDAAGNVQRGRGRRNRSLGRHSVSSRGTRGRHSAPGSVAGGSVKGNSSSTKLATLPSEASAFGLMANLSLRTPSGGNEKEKEKQLGVANVDFFRADPTLSPGRPLGAAGGAPVAPHILSRGLITPQEAERLFDIYFQTMNVSTSALDPVLHTPQKTFFRSPFLFTVVCALASRFYSDRPELYPRAMHFAQMAAGTALISGHKCVDLCQGYLLMAAYPVPARRWDEDRGWIYLGLAIRMATDLNLHLPSTAAPLNETHAREMLNRTRTWLHCFNLDRSMGSEYGKSPAIRNNDYIAMHAEDWWKSSPYNLIHSDIHICGYNADLKVMGNFMAKIYSDPLHPTGLNKNVDFEALATETDEELKTLAEKWRILLDQTDMTHPHNRYRCGMLKLAFSYGRLVALSFGFQHAFGKSNTDENPFFERCLTAASDVVTATVQDLGGGPAQRIYLRHGPIGVSIFVTFAASMLVKFLQPKFAAYLTREKRKEVRALVKSVITLLSSPEVSVDDKHGPSLYAAFLKNLLAAPLAKRPRRPTAPTHSSSSTSNPNTSPPTTRSAGSQGADGDSTPSSAASPASSHELLPAPTTAALSFDRFAPPLGGSVDPFMAIAVGDADPSVPNVFPPQSMPFSDDVQAMQALWPEDFSSWMSSLQTEFVKSDVGMFVPPDEGMYSNNSNVSYGGL